MHRNSEVLQPLQIVVVFSFSWWEFLSRATIQVTHTIFFLLHMSWCAQVPGPVPAWTMLLLLQILPAVMLGMGACHLQVTSYTCL